MHKLVLPATWGRMTPAEKAEYALDHAERTGGLCHQCADTFETDGELPDDAEECLTKYFSEA